MAQEQARQLLQQGIAAARGGRPDVARDALQQAVRLDPQNETIWLWLASVARDDKERLFCLRQLLAINPQNEFALKGLQALGVAPAEAAQPAPSASVPVLDEQKYARAQQAVDEFLRAYNPQPADKLGVEWQPKQKQRYGEGRAQRLQRTVYAAAAAAVVLVLGGLVGILYALGVFEGGDGDKVSMRATHYMTATATATLTPTPGGATPTPFPQQMAVPATSEPVGLAQGNPYGIATPTEIIPEVDLSVAGVIDGAIDLYSIGRYEEAVGTLEAQTELEGDHCYASLVYYQAMSYASQGGTQNLNRASQILEDALSYQPPRGYSTCQDVPLLVAAVGQVRYLQGNLSEALSWSERALRDEPELVQAVLTKASVQYDRGEYQAAWRTVSQVLAQLPSNTNLLLMLARIELANNNPLEAVRYAGQALYVDPVLLPALRVQAEAYNVVANQSVAGSESQLQYYGLAVRSAQILLLYYPGDPQGYLYLAQARIGEQNYSMAEEELSRIISVEDQLPESDQPIVRAAYRLRGDLYYLQGRWADAKADYTEIASVGLEDQVVLQRLVEIGFVLGDYSGSINWLDELLAADRENENYRLLQAKTLVETCTLYPAELPPCEYGNALELLSDSFLAELEGQSQALGYSYRAQARYWDTQDQRTLSNEERRAAYQAALGDIEQALSLRQGAVEHYYRGLILEEMDMLPQALDEYQWVNFWSGQYNYPFAGSDLETRIADISEELGITATPAEATEPPSEETPERASPTPTSTLTPTVTRTPTATPVPEPTATSPPLP